MAVRKASSYSKKTVRPFTRISRSKAKAYIKTNPPSKVAKFTGGIQKDFEKGKHPYNIKMIAEHGVQIRDNAIEAARQFVIKVLDEKALGQYFLAVKIHPHHLQRENKAAGGTAGADRISTGMTQAFGVVIGRAAIVKAGQEIFFVSCADEKTAKIARDALNIVKPKLPGHTRVVFEKVN